ncbi:LCP family protein [Alkalihalobacillus oceani]|uniref:LCP family glycopolymer transferase n=1 Tax=Halalkalibacter oceani TaxID=1653776 RepID=UPI00203E22CF|nr:LCP family protein [Halalkalibacter oceani]MCM3760924.1 LCP family protein [Halalkalibacter oceani]
MTQSRVSKRKRRTKRVVRTFIFIGLASFLILGGTIGYFFLKLQDVSSATQQDLQRGEKSEKREEPVSPSKDNISILFLGVDDRDGDLGGRTDAMLLATFNKELGTIKLLNIPRDSLVDIPGRRNQDKINHAHAFGGVDLAVETVEQLFDIPVDYYTKLNFIAFVEIVDALGGIDVEVPFAFSEMDSRDQHDAISLEQGLQTLNGEEALAFARMRKHDPRGDLGRGERQQEIIKAIIAKGASLSSINNYDEVLQSVETHLSTNLTFGNILALHSYAGSLHSIESLHLAGRDARINGVYYYELDPDSVRELSVTFQVHLGLIEAEQEAAS